MPAVITPNSCWTAVTTAPPGYEGPVPYGFGVVETSDGQTALDILHGGDTAVDALVSDVVMPGMSGPELVARARRERPDLPVLLLSGFAADEFPDVVAAEGDPRQAFLQKPYSPEALAIALEDLLVTARESAY